MLMPNYRADAREIGTPARYQAAHGAPEARPGAACAPAGSSLGRGAGPVPASASSPHGSRATGRRLFFIGPAALTVGLGGRAADGCEAGPAPGATR